MCAHPTYLQTQKSLSAVLLPKSKSICYLRVLFICWEVLLPYLLPLCSSYNRVALTLVFDCTKLQRGTDQKRSSCVCCAWENGQNKCLKVAYPMVKHSTEIRWFEKLCGWLSAMPPLQEQERSSCTNSLSVQSLGILFLCFASFFFMCSKQSNYMRLYCLKKMKMLYQTLLCYNSLQLQFHVYRYKLNAHLHAHATKTESQRFRNLMEIPRKFDLLIRMFYSASSCNEKNFVYLLACSPNRAYLDSQVGFDINQNIC